jgi:VanZ family protein
VTRFPGLPVLESQSARSACLVAAAVITASLFYLGAKPFSAGLLTGHWDKVAHLGTFSAIALFGWLGTSGRHPQSVAAVVAAIGALDELHQSTLPGRDASWGDFLCDLLAASLTCLLLHAIAQSAGRRA